MRICSWLHNKETNQDEKKCAEGATFIDVKGAVSSCHTATAIRGLDAGMSGIPFLFKFRNQGSYCLSDKNTGGTEICRNRDNWFLMGFRWTVKRSPINPIFLLCYGDTLDIYFWDLLLQPLLWLSNCIFHFLTLENMLLCLFFSPCIYILLHVLSILWHYC